MPEKLEKRQQNSEQHKQKNTLRKVLNYISSALQVTQGIRKAKVDLGVVLTTPVYTEKSKAIGAEKEDSQRCKAEEDKESQVIRKHKKIRLFRIGLNDFE